MSVTSKKAGRGKIIFSSDKKRAVPLKQYFLHAMRGVRPIDNKGQSIQGMVHRQR